MKLINKAWTFLMLWNSSPRQTLQKTNMTENEKAASPLTVPGNLENAKTLSTPLKSSSNPSDENRSVSVADEVSKGGDEITPLKRNTSSRTPTVEEGDVCDSSTYPEEEKNSSVRTPSYITWADSAVEKVMPSDPAGNSKQNCSTVHTYDDSTKSVARNLQSPKKKDHAGGGRKSVKMPNIKIIAVDSDGVEEKGAHLCTEWFKVRHKQEAITIAMPSSCADSTAGTEELVLILRAAFRIQPPEHVIGLLASDGHRTIVPLSMIASGQYQQNIKQHNESVLETNGNTVGKLIMFDLFVQTVSTDRQVSEHRFCRDGQPNVDFEESDILPLSLPQDDSTQSSESTETDCGYLSAFTFVRIVQKFVERGELNPARGQCLLNYMIKTHSGDEEVQGVVQASYRVAEWAQDPDYFKSMLGMIADIIMFEQTSSNDIDTPCLTLEQMESMIEAAFVLYDGHDLPAEHYIALLDAILQQDDAVQSVYTSYRLCLRRSFERNFRSDSNHVADDGSDDAENALDFLIGSLRHVALSLDPIFEAPESVLSDPRELEWVMHLGLQQITRYSVSLPDRNMLYNLFKTGDRHLVQACELFLEEESEGRLDRLEHSLLTRWMSIVEHSNRMASLIWEDGASNTTDSCADELVWPDTDEQESVQLHLGEPTGKTTESIQEIMERVPKLLLNALAVLQQKRISEDDAAALVATYALGSNKVLEAIYTEFISSGNYAIFLRMLEMLVKDSHDLPFRKEDPPQSLSSASVQESLLDVLQRTDSDELPRLIKAIYDGDIPLSEATGHERNHDADDGSDGPCIEKSVCSIHSRDESHDDGALDTKTAFDVLKSQIIQSKELGELELQALRLAIAKEDTSIRSAMDMFQKTRDGNQFRKSLLQVANQMIARASEKTSTC